MKKLLSTCLIVITLLSTNTSYVKAEKISNFKGEKAEVYTSSDAHQNKTGVKTAVSVSFIEDPNNSDLIALVSVKGFIPANLIKSGAYYWGEMYWTSKYNISLETMDDKNNVKILESIPSNKIETAEVSETMGYSIGGDISASKDSVSGGLNASYNVSRTVSYQQPDFKTIQKNDQLTKASWDIEFNSTKDGYDRSSYNALYGNQLFMSSRLYNEGKNNFTADKDLSPLISGGFSPNVVIALKAPKDTKKSKLMLEYISYRDKYTLNWISTNWWGENKSYQPVSTNHFYELDWQNHTVKRVGEGY